jgi:hypothetical protein
MSDETSKSEAERERNSAAETGLDGENAAGTTDSSKDLPPDSPGSAGEPSLGPACLVVSILALAAFCGICGIGSWFMFSDQYPFAEKGIQQQLIPWVETSQLAEADKRSIIRQLGELIPLLQNREIDRQQLTRLHYCLQDNPVLLWGAVQSILAQAPEAGLGPTEQQALERITQRLLRMATDRQLGRSDLEFTMQHLSRVREDQASVEVPQGLTAEQIREFMVRSERLLTENNVPNEPYNLTPAEAFAELIDKALHPLPPQ